MFFDWNGNGRKDDLFDDYMDYQMFKHVTGSDSGSNNGRGCYGTCCLYMLLVPAGVIGLIWGIAKLLA